MSETNTSARAEWRQHWKAVLAACVGFSFVSLMTASAGVFMQPLGTAFHWNRTQLSVGISIAALTTILGSPFMGMLIDRWGTRRMVLPGLALTTFAVAAFSQASGAFPQWIVLWIVWGACSMLIQSTVWSTAIAGLFVTGRGLALGITMSGAAAAQVIAPPLTNELIKLFGWRGAFVGLGLGWGGIAFLLALLFFFDVHNVRARALAAGGPAHDRGSLTGLTIPGAWRDWSLWRIGVSTFLILTVTIAVTVHAFPIVVEAGATRDQAAWLVSLAGLAGIAGKLVTGALMDRFHARWIGGVTLASTAIAYPLLIKGVAPLPLMVVGMMISGYAAGTKVQLCSYLTARYAGMRNYGVIFGVMTSAISLAAMLGPLLAGVAHDRFGSYTPLLLFGVAASLISGGLMFSLGRYPEWGSVAAAPALSEAGAELPGVV